MKIQCDVCSKDAASVYCSADDAALCTPCDRRVHHANKLAQKHPRFSLLHPSPKHSSLCDICQEKKALLFCQQDRAILCKDCDVAIHKVNQHTKNHSRFLLTGVKLSPTSSLDSPATKAGGFPAVTVPSPITSLKTQEISPDVDQKSTSSISEYLIDVLPGWQVEDFLDPPSSSSKFSENDSASFWEGDLHESPLANSFAPENMGLWVPQAPPPAAMAAPPPPPAATAALQYYKPSLDMGSGGQTSVVFGHNNVHKMTKTSNKWTSDDNGHCFTVPEMYPCSNKSKRLRTF